ncbi:MAG TPA: WG repeat-containing protein [Chitinophagaceae bacterium]|nr:WG repeat-containing protein [Chitinophagaceae bacterium]
MTYTFAMVLGACQPVITPSRLILKRDKETSLYAYFDDNGNKILGYYYAAYTDTITEYGIVADPGFVLIDKTGKHIFKIFAFDNGPDYTSEGIYRIVDNGKIGYVDSITSKVIIEPKFDCAYPFENGKAKVSVNCKTVKAFPEDEHSTWESDDWFYVDKTGKIVK